MAAMRSQPSASGSIAPAILKPPPCTTASQTRWNSSSGALVRRIASLVALSAAYIRDLIIAQTQDVWLSFIF